jgi:murein DD-endopeptidase MepM/ murein hydrolase activator NlpD
LKHSYFVLTNFLLLFFIFVFNGKDSFPNKVEIARESELLKPINFNDLLISDNFNFDFPSFIIPLKGTYKTSSKFGNREVIVKGIGGEQGDFHRGIDLIVTDKNNQVLAASDGIVELHYPPPSKKFKGHPIFGGMIVLRHGKGIFTVYGHMKQTFVHTGEYVTKGKIIGIVGNTGVSTGTHLHFEVLIDPNLFF